MAQAMTEAPWVRAGADIGTNLKRWLTIWVAIGVIVVLVVIGYLIGIVSALNSIDDNLAVAEEAVVGAGGNVQTLPDQVQQANQSLTGIDTALEPIPGQADQVIANLSSIASNLTTVDNSLKDTSGVLVSALGVARDIDATLESADEPFGPCAADSCAANKDGVQNIHQRVAIANNVLTTAKGDTGNILAGLVEINDHLQSACQAAGPGQCADDERG